MLTEHARLLIPDKYNSNRINTQLLKDICEDIHITFGIHSIPDCYRLVLYKQIIQTESQLITPGEEQEKYELPPIALDITDASNCKIIQISPFGMIPIAYAADLFLVHKSNIHITFHITDFIKDPFKELKK